MFLNNSNLDQFLTYHLLKQKMISRNSDLMDLAIDQDPDLANKVKNVCAKVSVELSDNIDSTCKMLNVSKRQFIENALIEALNRSEQLFDEIDPFEVNSK